MILGILNKLLTISLIGESDSPASRCLTCTNTPTASPAKLVFNHLHAACCMPCNMPTHASQKCLCDQQRRVNWLQCPVRYIGCGIADALCFAAAALAIAARKPWKRCQARGSLANGQEFTIRGVAASICPCMLPRTLTVHLTASPEH